MVEVFKFAPLPVWAGNIDGVETDTQKSKISNLDGWPLAVKAVFYWEETMTKCEYLQFSADRCTVLATTAQDQNMKRFYANAAEGFRRRLEKMTIAELEAPCFIK